VEGAEALLVFGVGELKGDPDVRCQTKPCGDMLHVKVFVPTFVVVVIFEHLVPSATEAAHEVP